MTIMERCGKCGLVPVVVIEHSEDAVPTARALIDGGIDVMEITMRTPAASEAIRRVCAEVPEMLVGAGTVTSLEQCKAILEAGAKFIVSPGYDSKIVEFCNDAQMPVLPGCVTPTEIMGAMQQGIRLIKFFPAGIYGGLKAMKALAGPFPGIKFLPTGGVNQDNLAEYISAPFIEAVGGSWICTKMDIAEHRFEAITQMARAARTTIDETRE